VQRWPRRPWLAFVAGWIALEITFDWPVGKLGAGYLASVHTLQFLLLTLLVGLCFAQSIPAEGWLVMAPEGSRAARALRWLARPLPGLLCYNLIVVTTHLPAVVDVAMTSQLGTMAIDFAWLLAGFFLWWPIVGPARLRCMGAWGTIGFIFGATVIPTIPAMMMVFTDWPLYRLYELAPRVSNRFSANNDIKLAGLSMKLFGDIPLWIAARVVFSLRSRTGEDHSTS
jgi:putative membrane protein